MIGSKGNINSPNIGDSEFITHQSKRTQSTRQKSEITQSTPDFQELHLSYTKSILRGRHPRSFPKKSELWYHCNASNDRLKKVAKGHEFWSVVNEENEKNKSEKPCQESFIDDSKLFSSISRYVSDNTVNGIYLDFSTSIQLHYGMSVVVINGMDEILCVDKWDEVRCKPRQHLSPTDRIVFRLIDISDPKKPTSVHFGNPIWLQPIDSKNSSENSFQSGHVVGAKLYGPPIMPAMQLDLSWGPLKNMKDGNQPPSSSLLDGTRSRSSSAAEGQGFFLTSDSSMSPLSPVHSVSDQTLDKDQDDESSIGGDSLALSRASTSPLRSQGKSRGKGGEVKDKEAHQEQPRADYKPSEICGLAFSVRIVETTTKRNVDVYNPSGEVVEEVHASRYYSKQAWHLGKWIAMSADRDKTDSLENTGIRSMDSVYLAQGLYCLGTSQGSERIRWPKLSFDVTDPAVFIHSGAKRLPSDLRPKPLPRSNPKDSKSKLGEEQQVPPSSSKASGKSVAFRMEDQSDLEKHILAESISHLLTSDSHHQRMRIMQSIDSDESSNGCLRKIIIREPPYEHLVERRCVWKFCAVDNPADLRGSVQDQMAQRLMIKAREGLKKSELNRTVGREYKGLNLEGSTLLGGESFSRTLRAISSKSSFELDSKMLESTRIKHREIIPHFESVWDSSYRSINPVRASPHSPSNHSGLLKTNSSLFSSSLAADQFSPSPSLNRLNSRGEGIAPLPPIRQSFQDDPLSPSNKSRPSSTLSHSQSLPSMPSSRSRPSSPSQAPSTQPGFLSESSVCSSDTPSHSLVEGPDELGVDTQNSLSEDSLSSSISSPTQKKVLWGAVKGVVPAAVKMKGRGVSSRPNSSSSSSSSSSSLKSESGSSGRLRRTPSKGKSLASFSLSPEDVPTPGTPPLSMTAIETALKGVLSIDRAHVPSSPSTLQASQQFTDGERFIALHNIMYSVEEKIEHSLSSPVKASIDLDVPPTPLPPTPSHPQHSGFNSPTPSTPNNSNSYSTPSASFSSSSAPLRTSLTRHSSSLSLQPLATSSSLPQTPNPQSSHPHTPSLHRGAVMIGSIVGGPLTSHSSLSNTPTPSSASSAFPGASLGQGMGLSGGLGTNLFGPSDPLGVVRKMDKLRQEDDLVTKALLHKDNLQQKRKVMLMFQELNDLE